MLMCDSYAEYVGRELISLAVWISKFAYRAEDRYFRDTFSYFFFFFSDLLLLLKSIFAMVKLHSKSRKVT